MANTGKFEFKPSTRIYYLEREIALGIMRMAPFILQRAGDAPYLVGLGYSDDLISLSLVRTFEYSLASIIHSEETSQQSVPGVAYLLSFRKKNHLTNWRIAWHLVKHEVHSHDCI